MTKKENLSYENGNSARSERSKKIKKEVIEYAKVLAAAAVLAVLIMVFVARSFYIDGRSMEPNYHDGQRIMAEKISYRFTSPKRGDVVVFSPQHEPGSKFIKRVIGVVGDKVEVKERKVYINDVEISEPYILMETLWNYGPVVVPEGTVFVMGDNRNNSQDSRSDEVGMVSLKSIEGKGLFTYWPFNQMGIVKHYRDYPVEIDQRIQSEN